MRSKGKLLRFLIVGHADGGDLAIGLHPAGGASRLTFSAGPHMANVGAQLPLREVLDPTRTRIDDLHASTFADPELAWLVAILIQLGQGVEVTEKAVIEAYREQHGRSPASELLPRFGS